MTKLFRFISLLVALLEMAACSGQEKSVKSDALSGQPTQQQVTKQAILKKRVAVQLEKGSYRRALELMGGRNHPGTPAAGMEREYTAAVNGLIAAGEEAFSRGDYATAGRSFRFAVDFYPLDPVLRNRTRWEPKQLKTHLEACSSRLMEQGLQEYRRGNLESAIRKWKGVIGFDAGHTEARKAIETASVQLRALQNMETASH